MNISGVNLDDYSVYNGLTKEIQGDTTSTGSTSFDSVLNSAKDMIGETNQLSNQAEQEEINYAMGTSTSLHDLQVAQQKANVSLQYTVAVKNTAMEAYKSLLNMQF